MQFLKVQGTLNDFVLIDETKEDLHLGDIERSMWAVKLCDRKQGVGADGVLFVNASAVAHAKMRIFNADGSEALMCGNGLRCFGRYIIEQSGDSEVKIETLKAIYTVNKDDAFDPDMEGYKIYLDNVLYFGKTENTKVYQTEAGSALQFDHLTVSNPHVVAFGSAEDINDQNLVPLGELANKRKDIFGEGMNVNLVRIVAPRMIYVRTYERGVGITKSCGTGMTSSVTAYARTHGLLEEWITVFNDGGMIRCRVHETSAGYAVEFVGNATFEYEGLVLSTLDEPLAFTKSMDRIKEREGFDLFFKKTRKALED